jgi:hypothetical protein
MKKMIATLLAAGISTAAFGQTKPAIEPPPLPADDPRLVKSREAIQKSLDEVRAQLEEMKKHMAGQGIDIQRIEIPRVIIDQPGGGVVGGAIGVGAGGGAQNFTFQIAEPKKEKAAYLGTGTSPASATLREQLKLPKGIGLTVDFVDKDSPAASAGLQQHDVLTKIDDQLLVNMPQLATLVRTHKAGDSVKLTYIRAGTENTVDVKLVEKEVPVLDDAIMNIQPFTLPVPPPGLVPGVAPRGDILLPRPGNDGGPNWQPAGRVTVKTENGVTVRTLIDDEQRLTLAIDKDGTKTLGVEKLDKNAPNKDGEIVFSGPIDTEEQRKKLPEGVLAKLKRLESDRVGGIQLNLGGNGQRIVINGNAGGGAVGKSIVARSDNDGSIRLETTNGDKHLTAKDKTGAVVFDGPINTEEERKKIPEDLLKKIETMEGRR